MCSPLSENLLGFGPLRARKKARGAAVPLVLVALLVACATPTDPAPRPQDRPFIKLARRQMAVLLTAEGSTPDPRTGELVDALRDGLADRYRVPVIAMVTRSPDIRRLPRRVLAKLALHQTDDVVFVSLATGTEALSGRAEVYVLNGMKRAHRVEVKGAASGAAFASQVIDRLASVWTDPGSAPALDPLVLADTLARAGACKDALEVYARFLPKRSRDRTIKRIQQHVQSQDLAAECRRKVDMAAKVAADRKATFRVDVVGEGVDPRLVDGVRKVVAAPWARKTLSRFTNKPVAIRITAYRLILDLRYHPQWYHRAVGRRPLLERDLPVFYLDPYEPLYQAVHRIKAATVGELPKLSARQMNGLTTALRLSRLSGDALEVDFLVEEGRILYTQQLVFRRAGLDAVVLESALAGVTRSGRFVLGEPQTVQGDLTQAGLVYRFLELDKLER